MPLILHESGNVLDSGCDLLVCPVNCVPGVMGAGLAKAFADRWPELIDFHRMACQFGKLSLKSIVVTRDNDPPSVAMLATKDHWKYPSRLIWVYWGLASLSDLLYSNLIRRHVLPQAPKIDSVAFPALGCGLGGLPWQSVERMVRSWADLFPEIDIHLYSPGSERR